jgi:murein L,D-transpeptidase YcbB/YkuD
MASGMACRKASIAILLLGLFLVPFGGARAEGSGEPGVILTRLTAPGGLAVGDRPLDQEAMRTFYAARGYALAWNAEGVGLGERAAVAVAALGGCDADGLDPKDYHTVEIAALAAAETEADRLDRDLLVSDGLLRYMRDISGGRIAPARTDERVGPGRVFDADEALRQAATLDPSTLAVFLAGLPPATDEYRAMKAMLAKVRAIADAGGWQKLPDGGSIHPGDRDPAIPALRQRVGCRRRRRRRRTPNFSARTSRPRSPIFRRCMPSSPTGWLARTRARRWTCLPRSAPVS